MTIYGYARVSTDGQTLDNQVEALKAAGVEKIFNEKGAGARADRPQLAKMLATIAKKDVVIVTRLDRLARSTRDLLNIIEALKEQGAAFRSLGDQWADTTTPHGRLMLTVLGGLAEFERELIRARTSEGRARAKARGQHMGRRPTLNADQQQMALKALVDGTATQADLARLFDVSQSTISRLATKEIVQRVPALDKDTERAARAFMRRLEGKYPLIEGIVFGSRARGDYRPDSDADLAVVLKGKRGDRWAAVRDMARIAFDVMLETGILVEALPLWAEELERPETFSNPALIETIKREGLHL
ncbi:MAG: recombinase family protein [Beijerinckiaceae bacterium]